MLFTYTQREREREREEKVMDVAQVGTLTHPTVDYDSFFLSSFLFHIFGKEAPKGVEHKVQSATPQSLPLYCTQKLEENCMIMQG